MILIFVGVILLIWSVGLLTLIDINGLGAIIETHVNITKNI